MKKYHYQKIEKYNKCILIIEYIFIDENVECNVYPVARLTHYRYMINQRLSKVSDWVREQILSGVSIHDIPSKFAIGSTVDDYAKHTFINYGDGKCANIMEHCDLYYYNDDGSDSFRISNLQSRIPNQCVYKIKDESQDWIEIPIPKQNVNESGKQYKTRKTTSASPHVRIQIKNKIRWTTHPSDYFL